MSSRLHPALSTLVLSATLALATSGVAHAQSHPELLGHPAAASAAVHTVQIGPDTATVHVDRFDTVKFVTPQGSFTVRFDGVLNSGQLQSLAPAGTLTHAVSVHVLPNGGDFYE